MHLVSPNKIIDQTNVAVTSAVRSASCTHGWLRFVIECFFGLITVCSFIVIVVIAVKSPRTLPRDGRCDLQGCRVICSGAPYFDEFEDHIHISISALETSCERVYLTLRYPMFRDGKMPKYWLSALKPNIHELAIVEGNLRYIESSAFMTSFAGNLHSLVLLNITIATWTPLMLVGLNKLVELSIRDSRIGVIDANALEPVDDTLINLAITRTGPWNPANVTGSSHFENLFSVVLSSNQFESILGPSSFSRLHKCKILYLNNCEIQAIQTGTFDNLVNIEMLYLNDNSLKHLPAGLFDSMIARPYVRARIALHNNYWHCNCSDTVLQRLLLNGMLLIDPVCHSPVDMKGNYVSHLREYCGNDPYEIFPSSYTTINVEGRVIMNIESINEENVLVDNSICDTDNTRKLHIISPLSNFKCQSNDLPPQIFPLKNLTSHKNDLIKPTFAVKRGDFSMVEITSSGNESYGLLWYHNHCPNKVYCVNTLPNVLRIYNIDYSADIVFCPLGLTLERIDRDKCISFSAVVTEHPEGKKLVFNLLMSSIVCLIFGAICVYAIIHKHPTLLKGSKRILLVKHKNVDALILPPKVPPRLSLPSEGPVTELGNKNIFLVPNNEPYRFMRSKSKKSLRSTAPSYISALEPTEDQLVEWRLRHHFDNASTLTTLSLDVCSLSWIQDEKPLHNKTTINDNNCDTLTHIDF